MNLLAGEPLVHVDAHELPDEVFRLLADVVPVRGVELEFACKMRILKKIFADFLKKKIFFTML